MLLICYQEHLSGNKMKISKKLHKLNNILQIITGASEVLIDRPYMNERDKYYLQTIIDEIQKGAIILQQIYRDEENNDKN